MEILIGVSGGVAAYKTAVLTSALVQEGHGVQVVITRAGSEFVGAATFRALTGRAVVTDVFDARYPLGAHIELADRADLLCVAPASADFIGKLAHGLADDILSTLALAYSGPLLLAPAMNADMWEKPSVQRNISLLREDGAYFVGPGDGWQSCRRSGMGRMAEATEIQMAITQIVDA